MASTLKKEYYKKSKGEKTMKNVNTFSGKMLIQAGDLVDLCEREIERQHEIQETAETRNAKSNCSKQVRKMELLENILMSVPCDLWYDLEGCRGDDVRGWTLCNAGSLVECTVKYHYGVFERTVINGKEAEVVRKTYGPGVDLKQGFCPKEVKASLVANALATPSDTDDEATTLVNAVGVWSIKKADVMSYVNKNGRLPHNVPCGKPIKWLAERLGFEVE